MWLGTEGRKHVGRQHGLIHSLTDMTSVVWSPSSRSKGLVHFCRLDGACLVGQDKTGGCELVLDTLFQQELFCPFLIVLASTEVEPVSCAFCPQPRSWHIVERAEIFVTTAVCTTR